MGIADIGATDTTPQFAPRHGCAFAYATKSAVYADCQFTVFRNDAGRLRVNRLSLGVDHSIGKGLCVRGGAALDACGNASWTTGMGICPSGRISIDIVYQENMFPKLERESGRSRALTPPVGS